MVHPWESLSALGQDHKPLERERILSTGSLWQAHEGLFTLSACGTPIVARWKFNGPRI